MGCYIFQQLADRQLRFVKVCRREGSRELAANRRRCPAGGDFRTEIGHHPFDTTRIAQINDVMLQSTGNPCRRKQLPGMLGRQRQPGHLGPQFGEPQGQPGPSHVDQAANDGRDDREEGYGLREASDGVPPWREEGERAGGE